MRQLGELLMEPVSLPPLMALAIMLYIGVHHLFFYLRVRDETFNLYFAFACFSAATYDLFSAFLYSSHSFMQSAVWQKWQILSLISFVAFIAFFLGSIIKTFNKWERRVNDIAIPISTPFIIALLIFIDGFDPSTASVRYVSLFDITYYEASPKPIIFLIFFMFIAMIGWATYLIVKHYRRGQSYLKPTYISLLIFFMIALNDILVGIGALSSIFLLEYGFSILAFGMNLSIQKNYRVLFHETKNQNAVLEKRIQERTKDLEKSYQEYKDLSHMISHDLTNILGAVKMGIKLIENGECSFDEISNKIYQSSSSGLGLVTLFRQLQALNEKKVTVEPVNLASALHESLEILENNLLSKGITALVEVDSSFEVSVEHFSFVNSVMNNILSNAIKFSYPGSVIYVTAIKKDTTIVLKIQDYGVGIPQKVLDTLFGKTIVSSRGTLGEIGSGFGLLLVKKFTDLYGGHITLSSEQKVNGNKSSGTTVSLHLPIA